ncbi:MAG: methyltransferase [Rhodocyclaceae bacterium]|nr:methyltransferase [Rhodocyclaceae bacterium]
MRLSERQSNLDTQLDSAHTLWHPQPFRDIRPAWCADYPDLLAELLALDDATAEALNNDGRAALGFLANFFPAASDLVALSAIPACTASPKVEHGWRWAWEIPGRKQQQIEAFAAAAHPTGLPVLDWCAGKGHLGRLLALQWQVAVTSLEIDPVLCDQGGQLAARSGVSQKFACKNALTVTNAFSPQQQAVALHACGDLHRRLIYSGAEAGVARLEIAPCCYYRGVAEIYQPLSGALQTSVTRDDARLAVTETVTASARLKRQRDKEMAWKLGFDLLRREISGESLYRSFKPVPAACFRGDFSAFISLMAQRENMLVPQGMGLAEFESLGWQRQREVMRLSIVRHAFRRPLEVLLVQDLGLYLEAQGYEVSIGSFCERQLTPRNLLISARRA